MAILFGVKRDLDPASVPLPPSLELLFLAHSRTQSVSRLILVYMQTQQDLDMAIDLLLSYLVDMKTLGTYVSVLTNRLRH